jgi:hypothetical protein
MSLVVFRCHPLISSDPKLSPHIYLGERQEEDDWKLCMDDWLWVASVCQFRLTGWRWPSVHVIRDPQTSMYVHPFSVITLDLQEITHQSSASMESMVLEKNFSRSQWKTTWWVPQLSTLAMMGSLPVLSHQSQECWSHPLDERGAEVRYASCWKYLRLLLGSVFISPAQFHFALDYWDFPQFSNEDFLS